MKNVVITFDGDQKKEFPINTTYLEISQYSKFKDTVLGVKKDNEIYNLNTKVSEDQTIEFFDVNSIDGAKIYKAAVKFIFEVAVKSSYDNVEVEFLHSVPGGMLSEIKYQRELEDKDISQIKREMAKLIDDNEPFIKYNILKKEAIKFYESNNTPEKAQNLSVYHNIVVIYKLKKYLNYFYVPLPASTRYIKQFELKYLGNNRLIILYPSNLTNGKMPDYVHNEGIIKSFYEAQSWLKRLDTPYLSDLNNLISQYKIKGFIESCELHFNDQIRQASEEIIRNKDHRFIMIAGPSSSGKTTTTRVLASYLRSKGYDPVCISIDDYFVNREDSPKDEKGEYDFECLQAIDINLLNTHLMNLLKGEEINVPVYNFLAGKRENSNKFLKLKENSILLIEGLHSLNDDLTPYIPEKYKYKIYLSPFIPLNIDRHNYISTLDLRLIRRIVRDNQYRGKSVDYTIETWQSVRNGEEKYIFPYAHQTNYIINTALPYELGVLKVYAEPLLLSVKTNSKYYEEARRLFKFLQGFYPISSEYVSKSSILREFIGGNNND